MMMNNDVEKSAMDIYWEVWAEQQQEAAEKAKLKEIVSFNGSIMTYAEFKDMKENRDWKPDWK